jgi:hypothetical protein
MTHTEQIIESFKKLDGKEVKVSVHKYKVSMFEGKPVLTKHGKQTLLTDSVIQKRWMLHDGKLNYIVNNTITGERYPVELKIVD